MSLTSYQSEILIARAVLEALDGTPGQGVQHCRSIVALAEAGMNDPSALPQPIPTPRAPNTAEVITNASLDHPSPPAKRKRYVSPGTREWLDLEEQVAREQSSKPSLTDRIRGRA